MFLLHINYLIILSFFFFPCLCVKFSSVQKSYDRGLKAYTKERWTECIKQFEESLHLYKLYKSVVVNCRIKCNSEPYISDIKENIEELKFYEKVFHRRACLLKCQDKDLNGVQVENDVDETLQSNMQRKRPYEYLHICYFQMFALPKAASAAYTYLAANPEDESMKANLEYYLEQPEVDAKEVVDLESEDYAILYNIGVKAYSQNNWAETVANMEEVLTDYLSSENVCRAECEQQPEQEWSREFTIGMSNNIAALLHCQQQCEGRLKSLSYNSGVEFISDVLNYIQICYYKLDRFDDAAKAVATYLMMLPNDEDMLENKKIYSTIINPESFKERSDIVHYYKRDVYEKYLINIFHQGNKNDL